MLRIPDVRLPPDHSPADLERAAARMLGIEPGELLSLKIHRRSIDARRRGAVVLSYTLDAAVADEAAVLAGVRDRRIAPAREPRYSPAEPGAEPLRHRPVVVGFGPAGMFAALLLAESGYRPLVLERGRPVARRVEDVREFGLTGRLDPESNVQFGEGGAGTFSDGKLYTLISDPRVQRIFELLAAAGAPREILTDHKPHIGTDKLRAVVVSLRRRIEAAGGEVRFGARLSGLAVQGGRLAGVEVNGGERLEATAAILALGHSARDTLAMLHSRGLAIEAKPFAVGVRVEHPQAMVDRARYGPFAGHPRLGPAEYKLVHHPRSGRSVYTFCMCPGGSVIAAASEPGGVVTNGMSEHARAGDNANAALLVGVRPADFGSSGPLAGVEFQRRWERAAFELGGGGFRAPVQRLEDFLRGRASDRPGEVLPSYAPGWRGADLSGCLPDFVSAALREALPALDAKLRGFALPDAVLTGVETRSSSPVRIQRGADLQGSIGGVYPAGEGAGWAGGIVSAAVDGLKAAEAVISRFAPP